jgi:hypothetical protein
MPNLHPYEHTTVAQNKAHRADLTWAKVGRSEYLRSDGVTIRKSTRTSFAWRDLPPQRRTRPAGDQRHPSPHTPAAGPSLTIAKDWADAITADTPAFVPRHHRRHPCIRPTPPHPLNRGERHTSRGARRIPRPGP